MRNVLPQNSLSSGGGSQKVRYWHGCPCSEGSQGESLLASPSFWFLAFIGLWQHSFYLCLCFTSSLAFWVSNLSLLSLKMTVIEFSPHSIYPAWFQSKILNNNLQKPYFQINSPSQVRIWTYLFGGTIQSISWARIISLSAGEGRSLKRRLRCYFQRMGVSQWLSQQAWQEECGQTEKTIALLCIVIKKIHAKHTAYHLLSTQPLFFFFSPVVE